MSLTTSILATCTPERLKRAVDGLCDGTLTCTLASADETEIRGFVRNGDSKEYGVVISAAQTFCSCKDAMYRKGICKHVVALALYAIRNPRQEPISSQEGIPPAQTLPVTPTLDEAQTMSPQEMKSYNLHLCRARREHGQRRSA
jgi:predicted nucleic acid-binding Zn finger protein